MLTELDYRTIWQQVMSSMRSELGKVTFDTWFSKVDYQKTVNGKVYLLVNGFVAKDWIASRYLKTLEEKFSAICHEPVQILLLDKNAEFSENLLYAEADMREDPKSNIQAANLNARYTFDTFVVGNSNRFAHAACYAVGETPATAYNPLFIYGGVGLGKTHLMHAIGHRVLEKNPLFKVRYVSCEQFTNELIGSIRDDKAPDFRNRYRSCDVLLIDDIQFLAGKERTQEELFHTFNTLYEANKQVVLSSDRPPKSIPTLEDRLRSRFEWGLITDIQAPDLETRIAILMKKSQTDQLDIPYDILTYIAASIQSNIRELEGALVRLVAYAKIAGKPINMETTVEALKDILPPPKPAQITIPLIQKEVCAYYQVSMEEFLSKKRNKQLVLPRHIAMYLCRKLTSYSLPLIGEEFGGRDHTTVLHAIEKIEQDIQNDEKTRKAIEELNKKINPNAKPLL